MHSKVRVRTPVTYICIYQNSETPIISRCNYIMNEEV